LLHLAFANAGKPSVSELLLWALIGGDAENDPGFIFEDLVFVVGAFEGAVLVRRLIGVGLTRDPVASWSPSLLSLSLTTNTS
jgi:hypothetical protein